MKDALTIGCGEIFEDCESSGCGNEDYDEDNPEVKYPIEYCPSCLRVKEALELQRKEILEKVELSYVEKWDVEDLRSNLKQIISEELK